MSDALGALAELRLRFLDRSAGDLAELTRWWAAGAPAGETAHRMVHRLAGAAGTFGFHEVSRLAKQIDERLAAGEAPGTADGPALIEALTRAVGGNAPQRPGFPSAA